MLRLEHLQQREEHWAIVDLVGKGSHVLGEAAYRALLQSSGGHVKMG